MAHMCRPDSMDETTGLSSHLFFVLSQLLSHSLHSYSGVNDRGTYVQARLSGRNCWPHRQSPLHLSHSDHSYSGVIGFATYVQARLSGQNRWPHRQLPLHLSQLELQPLLGKRHLWHQQALQASSLAMSSRWALKVQGTTLIKAQHVLQVPFLPFDTTCPSTSEEYRGTSVMSE